jgi:outer membrane protein assembly factor BamB
MTTGFPTPARTHAKAAPAILALVLATAAGCNDSNRTSSSGSTSSGSGGGSTSTASGGGSTSNRTIEEMRSSLDAEYTIGPTAADQLGYRVAWNATCLPGGNSRLAGVNLAGDSLYLTNTNNLLSRVSTANGATLWSWPVANVGDSVLGVARSIRDGVDWTLVLTEGDIHVFETGTGNQVSRHRLHRVASTAPVVYFDDIVYGSVNGTVVWHQFVHNAYLRGNSVVGSVSADPVMVGDSVLIVSSAGRVALIDLRNGAKRWEQSAREAIVAAPGVSDEAVYVASRDQYLYCFDLRTGERLWRRLHSQPLTEPPVVIGDHVFAQTPDLGLACYDALPVGDLDGNVVWNTSDVTGTVIGRRGARLLTWDDASRRVYVVDQATGDVTSVVDLPRVRSLLVSAFDEGELFAVSDEGVVTRLVPRR